ncbi:AraC family transcriptional regulator [Streptomyces sp. T1317-0309]|nr:AraC family transcriptional regulator [Streptomyces sp. T1317-0309]
MPAVHPAATHPRVRPRPPGRAGTERCPGCRRASHVGPSPLQSYAEGGISLADWIRTHRLEECRNELRRPTARLTTIEAVARRWGFTDMSNFGRIFRMAYGMSPREWRDLPTARKPPVAGAGADAQILHEPLH